MEKILILGGTNFIGRNLIDELVQLDNFDTTIFNRGLTNSHLYPQLRKIYGDRNTSDINLISDENWDYVIDLSCYFPDSLNQILKALNPKIKRYIFISTCSVYDNNSDKSALRSEDAQTLTCSDKESVNSSPVTYGKRKAKCEKILMQSGLIYSIFRPALIYGQYDNTDRFYYWLYQVNKEPKILIPNKGDNTFSVTYVKDLIQAVTKTLNTDLQSDIYNMVTYPKLSISILIDIVSKIVSKHPKLFYGSTEFLAKNNIAQWTDLPLWLDCESFTYNNTKVLRDLKLEIRDFEISIKETIDYYTKQNWVKPKYGMTEDLKKELITKLRGYNREQKT